VAAALWRPARLGWALAAGAIVPLIAQGISAIVEITEPALTQLGISQSQASRDGLTGATPSLTTWFWVYCAFVIVLVLLCGWLAARPDRPVTVAAAGTPLHTGPAAGWPGMTAQPGPGMTAQPGPGMTAPAGSLAEGQAATAPAADQATVYPGQPEDTVTDPGTS
jgi:hypothetical protein